ncbi:unnamed protein product [Cochlearia groenlandica]
MEFLLAGEDPWGLCPRARADTQRISLSAGARGIVSFDLPGEKREIGSAHGLGQGQEGGYLGLQGERGEAQSQPGGRLDSPKGPGRAEGCGRSALRGNDVEEEEEGLERRKSKRGAEDADSSPRDDSRTRSRSADPVKTRDPSMPPPAARSDRSAPPGGGLEIPSLENMREPVRDLYARHSIALAEVRWLCTFPSFLDVPLYTCFSILTYGCPLFQSATTFNRLLCGYEGMLTEPGSLQLELTRAKEKLSLTERSLETMRIASEKNADRLTQAEDYRRQRDEARTAAAALEKRAALMLKRAEIAEEKSSRFEKGLVEAEESSRAMSVKYETLLKLRDRGLQVSSHEARRDVKGVGVTVVNQVKDHLLLMKKRSRVEREVAEIRANQEFLVGIQRGDYPDLEAEAASMAEDVPVVEAKLAAMPLPLLDLDELAKRFDDSPPPEDAVGCESALVLVEPQAISEAAPLEVTPLASASFDQFGSMTASFTVEDALNLREGIRPEGSESLVTGPAEGGQEVAFAEEELLQPGAGEGGSVDEEGQT